jgi:hypothetical protein
MVDADLRARLQRRQRLEVPGNLVKKTRAVLLSKRA